MSDFSPGGLIQMFHKCAGTSHLVSGWDAKPISKMLGVREGPYREAFSRKCIRLSPGESFTLADIEGPGVITRVYFTIGLKWPRATIRGLELAFYWDAEENPSVLAPLGDFFGNAFCSYHEYDSLVMSMLNGGYVSRFPMPFRKNARLVLTNSSPHTVEQIFFGITYYSGTELPEDSLYFHTHWKRSCPTEEGTPHVLLEAEGSGQYAGCHLFQQNLDPWLERGPFGWIQPGGVGIGNLEGWEEIFIDGGGQPVHHGTGTEEYVDAGPYFTHGKSTGVLEGCTLRSYLTGRTAIYRFHVYDPVPFESSFRMIWHHGLLDSVRSDFTSTAFWYQEEPHRPHSLPAFRERLPRSVLPHTARAVAAWPLVLGVKALIRTTGL